MTTPLGGLRLQCRSYWHIHPGEGAPAAPEVFPGHVARDFLRFFKRGAVGTRVHPLRQLCQLHLFKLLVEPEPTVRPEHQRESWNHRTSGDLREGVSRVTRERTGTSRAVRAGAPGANRLRRA